LEARDRLLLERRSGDAYVLDASAVRAPLRIELGPGAALPVETSTGARCFGKD